MTPKSDTFIGAPGGNSAKDPQNRPAGVSTVRSSSFLHHDEVAAEWDFFIHHDREFISGILLPCFEPRHPTFLPGVPAPVAPSRHANPKFALDEEIENLDNPAQSAASSFLR
jgi:hypothetical protein